MNPLSAAADMAVLTAFYCLALHRYNQALIRKYSEDHNLTKRINIFFVTGLTIGIVLYVLLLSFAFMETLTSLFAYWSWGFAFLIINAIAIAAANLKIFDEDDFVVVGLVILMTVNGGIFAGTWLADWLNVWGFGMFAAVGLGFVGAFLSFCVAVLVFVSSRKIQYEE